MVVGSAGSSCKTKFLFIYLFIFVSLIFLSISQLVDCMKDKQHAEAFWNHVSLAKEDSLPLGERVAALHHNSQIRNDVKLGHGGS